MRREARSRSRRFGLNKRKKIKRRQRVKKAALLKKCAPSGRKERQESPTLTRKKKTNINPCALANLSSAPGLLAKEKDDAFELSETRGEEEGLLFLLRQIAHLQDV